jgi:hypothetical protein
MSCWVGSYTEAGASVSGGNNAAYLAWAFCGPSTRSEAEQQAGAKLLAGPFSSQAEAQAWASSYNTNPNSVQAGSGLSASTGTATAGTGEPPGASALANFSSVQNALTAFYDMLANGRMWRSLGWLLLGVVLIVTGVGMLMKDEIRLPPILPV